MSLVNDALRRAQDAQKKSQQAPAPGPQLRPADPVAPGKRGMGILLLLVIALVALGGLVFLFQNRQKSEAREPSIATKPLPAVTATEVKPPVQEAAAPVAAPPSPTPAAQEKPVPAPVVSVPAPQLKLQAIFYSPGHSSAIISGKTVHAGDNFRGFRVAAITQTSATLVSATQTNIMTLEQD